MCAEMRINVLLFACCGQEKNREREYGRSKSGLIRVCMHVLHPLDWSRDILDGGSD